MIQIDWSKQPEGFPLWLEGLGTHRRHSGWYRRSGEVFEHENEGQFRSVREGQFFTIHERPAHPVWNGEGLPPVGIDVEIHNKSGRGVVEGAESFIGTTCKVLATFINMNGFEIVAVEDSGGSCMCFRADMCVPVRTPERIAKAARSKACDAMYGIMSSPPVRDGNRSDMAEALYDAGYRLFEIVEE